eukprot:gene5989-11355_t
MTVDKVLLVVSIIEGRRFPRKSNCKLLVEAKFDGETLSTDPVDHIENPDITTELAWESDKKSLHQHRLQRTPIKLQCYAIDANEKRKEPIGYCILDIRSAQLSGSPQKPTWFALLNSKYHGMKPEIKVVVSLEDENTKTGSPEAVKQKSSEETEDELQPVLDEEKGYYLIGKREKATDIFCLSVTIAAAKNLTKVIPSDRQLNQQDGFYFFYKLLGNEVTSEPFHDVINANFAAERASVRLFSNFLTLKKLLSRDSSIEFHFCCGKSSLGSTTVSVLPVVTDGLTKDNPSKIEGFFALSSPSSSPATDSTAQMAALVGISIVLRVEAEQNAGGVPIQQRPKMAQEDPSFLPEHPLSPPKKDDIKARSTPGKDADYIITENAREQTGDRAGKKTKRPLRFADGPSNESPQEEDQTRKSDRQRPSTKEAGAKLKVNEKSNHYCFSIDLRSIKNLDVERPVNCFCRYTYPFFGSSSPVLTSPSVDVRKNTEVLLPKSFCAFDFATNVQLLGQTLTRIPLIVEVWHRDPTRKDALLGVCQIDLSSVFTADKVSTQGNNYRQICSQVANIVTPDSFRRKVGLLHVVLGLEDFGPMKTQQTHAEIGTTQSLISASLSENTISEMSEISDQPRPASHRSVPQQQKQHQPESEEGKPRDLPEYKAAIELELWKEQQEDLFRSLLQEKEAKLMQTLAGEWKKREKEREDIFQRKVDEYIKLEEKLKLSISDLERREKQVAANEAEVHRLKSDLLREHEQKLSFLRDASVRMKEDCDHRIELERLKLQEVKEQCQRYKEQLTAAEKRYKDKEHEIMSLKEQFIDRPETKLQADLNLMLLEKAELERRVEQATKSKIHYKQQWGKALRELAKIKQNEQMAAKMRLKQQERELEHMRLRYLAAEEKEIIKSEKRDLAGVKEELQ